MAEKDPAVRLRRAVKENNLFLVKRLVKRTDQRNPDPGPRRYTSLAWAAVLGHEETFEFLLSNGHDDYEYSRDSDNNYVLMLLADSKPSLNNGESMGAILRMARMYYDRYPKTIDWQNIHGKTALHFSAQRGNEELVRMLCDLDADFDLTDYKANSPLHYASSWGHIPVVQLLIERGCQYSARNNQGFTAADYAYSFSTKNTLEDAARLQFENNKKTRRAMFNRAVNRGSDWIDAPPTADERQLAKLNANTRVRSGSGTSRTTNTSDSGDIDSFLPPTIPSAHSSGSSPSQPSGNSSHLHTSSQSSVNLLPSAGSSQLSPFASRVRERDADAMEKYLRRNRSESQGTTSTENRSHNGSFSSAGPSANGDDITSLNPNFAASGSSTPRRLRSSISATQLRIRPTPISPVLNANMALPEARSRSGTNPTSARPSPFPTEPKDDDDKESYIGPPSQFAQFPEPPLIQEANATPLASRRMAFHPLSKPHNDQVSNHRRGLSATLRGT